MKHTKQYLQIILSFTILISFGISDAGSAISTLVGRNAEGYLGPFGTIIGTDMNSGYFRKTTPHKILGFDFTFDMAYAMPPEGQTTYNFLIPDEEVAYSFPFKFPKDLLVPNDSELLEFIPTAEGSSDESLYQDQEIYLSLSVRDILEAPQDPAQNIFGDTTSTTITITPDQAVIQIKDQVVENTWEIAQSIPGIGTDYVLEYDVGGIAMTETIPALYSNEEEFANGYSSEIDSLIELGFSDLDLSVPVPGGLNLGKSIEDAGYPFGIPLPILQASVGLPFHTEITVRGIPTEVPIPSFGTLKFGGFGGKIGISEFFREKPKKQPRFTLSPNIIYILETPLDSITVSDIDLAITELETSSMDVSSLKILNDRFFNGDKTALSEIYEEFNRISQIPKQKKSKPKGWPIDVSIGYYRNDFELNMTSANVQISSNNDLVSVQAGKTLNLPSFLSFIGGLGIYGGIGFESSTFDLKYTVDNPLGFGCFSNGVWDGDENKTQSECTGSYESWQSGTPLDIDLSFPGDNKIRTTIGARLRILTFDFYADYNTGASNAYNMGLGFTFR